MIPACTIAKLASLGLSPEQAEVVAAMLAEVEQATEGKAAAAIEARRANDRERKERQRHGKSREVTGQHVTSGTVPSQVLPPRDNNSTPISSPSNSSLRSVSVPSVRRFAEFWAIFPKRVNRKTAEIRYASAVKAGVSEDRIIDGARRFAEAHRKAGTDPQFVKSPDAWLNAGKYDDEDLPSTPRAGPAPPPAQEIRNPALRALKRLEEARNARESAEPEIFDPIARPGEYEAANRGSAPQAFSEPGWDGPIYDFAARRANP